MRIISKERKKVQKEKNSSKSNEKGFKKKIKKLFFIEKWIQFILIVKLLKLLKKN